MHTPYGTWESPLTAEMVARQGLRLGAVAVDGDDIFWIEGRPAEGGRNVLVRRAPDGTIADITPAGFNVRTRVHEYGGGACLVSGGEVFFSNFADQRLYRMRARPGAAPTAVTPDGPWCYADAILDLARRRLVCVREDHSVGTDRHHAAPAGHEPVNTLVAIPLDAGEHAGDVIASGCDFYSTPRLSPDGARLSWLQWRHPQMPWDGTELWVAGVAADGSLAHPARAAGGDSESIYQPGWSPGGVLYYVSDRDGWWQIYRGDRPGRPVVANPPEQSEFGRPQWVFGSATWTFVGPARMVAAYTQRGRWHLAAVDVETGAWERVAIDLEPREWLVGAGAAVRTDGEATAVSPPAASAAAHVPAVVMVAASPTVADTVVRVHVETGAVERLRASSSLVLDPGDVSVPEAIEYPAGNGGTAHAFYYRPANARHTAAPGARPPLIAISHGGPTTAATGTLDLRVQFWTTRGFAVVDVNYGGSSGYGRAYRQRLEGRWGIVDVGDVVDAARHLVAAGAADPARLIVRGGSAGGYTTLAALTFHAGVFTAGASYYGVSDLEALARDTHKFESRYLDRLVGPYPARAEVYRERSPIHFADRLGCPLILFQGLEDKVVPPNQSAMMADAVRAKGLPVAYLAFDGEQHGFRRAETIARCLEAELDFYGRVFGFRPAGAIEPVAIDNLP